MTYNIIMADKTSNRFLGTRFIALGIREEIESVLKQNENLTLDFSDAEVTQAFIDELIGVLILRYGIDIVKKMSFKACSENVKAIIKFVISSRSKECAENTYPTIHA